MTAETERERVLMLAKESGHEIGIEFDYMGNAHYIPESLIKLIELTRAEALEEAATICEKLKISSPRENCETFLYDSDCSEAIRSRKDK